MGLSGRITHSVLGNANYPPLQKTRHDWPQLDETLHRHLAIPLPGISHLLSELPYLTSVTTYSPSLRPALKIPPIEMNSLITPSTESLNATSSADSSTTLQSSSPYAPGFQRERSVSDPSGTNRLPRLGRNRRAASMSVLGGLETVYEDRELHWSFMHEEPAHAGEDGTVSPRHLFL